MSNKIGVNACVLGHSLSLSQHIDVEQDRGKRVCVLGHSLSLSQHIDVEQDRGKRVCSRAGPGRLGFRLGWGGAPTLSGLAVLSGNGFASHARSKQAWLHNFRNGLRSSFRFHEARGASISPVFPKRVMHIHTIIQPYTIYYDYRL